MSFSYSINNQPAGMVIRLSGQLIQKHQADELLSQFEERNQGGFSNTIIDLENLDLINEAGIQVLITLLTSIRTGGAECVLMKPNNKLKSTEAYGTLAGIFTITENSTEAETVLIKK